MVKDRIPVFCGQLKDKKIPHDKLVRTCLPDGDHSWHVEVWRKGPDEAIFTR